MSWRERLFLLSWGILVLAMVICLIVDPELILGS